MPRQVALAVHRSLANNLSQYCAQAFELLSDPVNRKGEIQSQSEERSPAKLIQPPTS